ncbi:hypothetical protein GF322_05310, partial [Candidatus Dependentiae bacterium]|nr:hypothetical protein [Candidatus Dependentiae bacterium]
MKKILILLITILNFSIAKNMPHKMHASKSCMNLTAIAENPPNCSDQNITTSTNTKPSQLHLALIKAEDQSPNSEENNDYDFVNEPTKNTPREQQIESFKTLEFNKIKEVEKSLENLLDTETNKSSRGNTELATKLMLLLEQIEKINKFNCLYVKNLSLIIKNMNINIPLTKNEILKQIQEFNFIISESSKNFEELSHIIELLKQRLENFKLFFKNYIEAIVENDNQPLT